MKKKIGIIGAMGTEVELLVKNLTDSTTETVAGRVFHEGKIGGTEVVLVCSGIGKVNSAMSAQILIDRYAVTAIINTGIAGGAHGTSVRDVVISTEVTYHDMEGRILALGYPNLESFQADPELIALAVEACGEIRSFQGKIVTGDQFISDSVTRGDIVARHAPYAIEMEGGAIAHVAAANHLPFVVVRSISDNADDEADMSYDVFEKIAAQDAANIVIGMLHKMG